MTDIGTPDTDPAPPAAPLPQPEGTWLWPAEETAPRHPNEVLGLVMRGLGQLLITVGVVLLLFCVYELKITNLYTDHEQAVEARQLEQTWDTTRTVEGPLAPQPSIESVALGSGLAVLYVPRLGKGWHKVVVQGVGVPDLKKGPGHYPGTAYPGQVGNVVISGHRTTYGAPFNQLDELQVHDAIVLETRTSWFVYRVTGQQVVDPHDIGVTYPVPDHLGARPTQRLLTFTTCNPKYSARQRLVVRAVLESAQPRTPGSPLPVALDESA